MAGNEHEASRLLRKFADSRNRSDKIGKALRLTKQVDTFATVGIISTISEDAQEPLIMAKHNN
jgi:hypothetical protein